MQREGHFRGEATQGDTNIEHTLLRNEAWIYYGRPDNWQIERPLEYTYDRKNIQLFLMRCLVRAVPYFCRN